MHIKPHRLIFSRLNEGEEEVCYNELGCFRDSEPFDYLDVLPSPPEKVSDTRVDHAISNTDNRNR